MASEDINVGAISEALNNKVDLNQLNTNPQGLSYGSGWGMPSHRYVDLNLGASGSDYTAPANGYVYISKVTGANGQYVQAEASSGHYAFGYPVLSGGTIKVLLPVQAGIFRVTYNASGTTYAFRFIYAEGEQ